MPRELPAATPPEYKEKMVSTRPMEVLGLTRSATAKKAYSVERVGFWGLAGAGEVCGDASGRWVEETAPSAGVEVNL